MASAPTDFAAIREATRRKVATAFIRRRPFITMPIGVLASTLLYLSGYPRPRIVAVVSVYATYLALILLPRMHNLKMTIVDFPMTYIYGFVAFGFAMMTFRGVQVAIRHWRQGWSVLERPGEVEA